MPIANKIMSSCDNSNWKVSRICKVDKCITMLVKLMVSLREVLCSVLVKTSAPNFRLGTPRVALSKKTLLSFLVRNKDSILWQVSSNSVEGLSLISLMLEHRLHFSTQTCLLTQWHWAWVEMDFQKTTRFHLEMHLRQKLYLNKNLTKWQETELMTGLLLKKPFSFWNLYLCRIMNHLQAQKGKS